MLGLAGHHVLFVEDGFAQSVVQPERGIDLAAAFNGLLVKLVGAALFAVKGGLEAVADVKQHIDGADGIRVGGDALAIARCLKVQNGRPGRKDAPVNGVDEGLLLGKGEGSARGSERGHLLAVTDSGQGEGAKSGCYGIAFLHRQGGLLRDWRNWRD